jgi:hypothetical protein
MLWTPGLIWLFTLNLPANSREYFGSIGSFLGPVPRLWYDFPTRVLGES